MKKERQIQIPYSIYVDLVRYAVMDQDSPDLKNKIKKFIYSKMENELKRNAYTQYKTAPTPEERETARQNYLDRIGLPPDYRR